jgi:hypothetical protein
MMESRLGKEDINYNQNEFVSAMKSNKGDELFTSTKFKKANNNKFKSNGEEEMFQEYTIEELKLLRGKSINQNNPKNEENLFNPQIQRDTNKTINTKKKSMDKHNFKNNEFSNNSNCDNTNLSTFFKSKSHKMKDESKGKYN